MRAAAMLCQKRPWEETLNRAGSDTSLRFHENGSVLLSCTFVTCDLRATARLNQASHHLFGQSVVS